MSQILPPVPAHVPDHLIYDFDAFNGPEFKGCPHRSVLHLHKDAPPIFFTPRNGGHWVVTRAADAVDMLRQYEKFSSDPQFNKNMQRWPRTVPNQYDPPEHTEFRRIVNPVFSPAATQKMEPKLRELSRALIDEVYANGSCEFVEDIGQRFPVTVFLRMANAPLTDREMLIDMVKAFTRSPDRDERMKSLRALADYLTGMIAERRARPGDDLVSRVVTAQLKDRPMTDDETLGMVTLLFLGGIDTVAAMLTFIMHFLATNPGHYERLVAAPPFIATAVEELMRAFGVAQMERGVTSDLEYNGVQFRAGDRLLFLPQIYGLDDRQVHDPLNINFDRELSAHLAFGAGAHRCLGSHLARVEIRVFLEEWVARIPKFGMAVSEEPKVHGGTVWSIEELRLAWAVPPGA